MADSTSTGEEMYVHLHSEPPSRTPSPIEDKTTQKKQESKRKTAAEKAAEKTAKKVAMAAAATVAAVTEAALAATKKAANQRREKQEKAKVAMDKRAAAKKAKADKRAAAQLAAEQRREEQLAAKKVAADQLAADQLAAEQRREEQEKDAADQLAKQEKEAADQLAKLYKDAGDQLAEREKAAQAKAAQESVEAQAKAMQEGVEKAAADKLTPDEKAKIAKRKKAAAKKYLKGKNSEEKDLHLTAAAYAVTQLTAAPKRPGRIERAYNYVLGRKKVKVKDMGTYFHVFRDSNSSSINGDSTSDAVQESANANTPPQAQRQGSVTGSGTGVPITSAGGRSQMKSADLGAQDRNLQNNAKQPDKKRAKSLQELLRQHHSNHRPQNSATPYIRGSSSTQTMETPIFNRHGSGWNETGLVHVAASIIHDESSAKDTTNGIKSGSVAAYQEDDTNNHAYLQLLNHQKGPEDSGDDKMGICAGVIFTNKEKKDTTNASKNKPCCSIIIAGTVNMPYPKPIRNSPYIWKNLKDVYVGDTLVVAKSDANNPNTQRFQNVAVVLKTLTDASLKTYQPIATIVATDVKGGTVYALLHPDWWAPKKNNEHNSYYGAGDVPAKKRQRVVTSVKTTFAGHTKKLDAECMTVRASPLQEKVNEITKFGNTDMELCGSVTKNTDMELSGSVTKNTKMGLSDSVTKNTEMGPSDSVTADIELRTNAWLSARLAKPAARNQSTRVIKAKTGKTPPRIRSNRARKARTRVKQSNENNPMRLTI
jgi:hypothetical protein